MSTVRSYKSALVWLHKENRMTLSPDTDLELENFLKGYKRKVADIKSKGGMDILEGKTRNNFEGYYRVIVNAMMTITAG
jgi:hypothetical protein